MSENPRRSIVSDEDLKKLLDEVNGLPERIQVARDLIDAEQFRISQMTDGIEEQAELDNIKNETYFEVKEAKIEGNGKPKYSNAEERDAAVTIFCNKNPDYIKALDAVVRAKRKKAEGGLHLGKLNNQLKYLIDLSYGRKAVLAVVAGLSVEEIDTAALTRLVQIKHELSAFVERLVGENHNV